MKYIEMTVRPAVDWSYQGSASHKMQNGGEATFKIKKLMGFLRDFVL